MLNKGIGYKTNISIALGTVFIGLDEAGAVPGDHPVVRMIAVLIAGVLIYVLLHKGQKAINAVACLSRFIAGVSQHSNAIGKQQTDAIKDLT